jgi:hypothetical protein
MTPNELKLALISVIQGLQSALPAVDELANFKLDERRVQSMKAEEAALRETLRRLSVQKEELDVVVKQKQLEIDENNQIIQQQKDTTGKLGADLAMWEKTFARLRENRST